MTSSFKLALVVSTAAVVSGVAGYLVARHQLSNLVTFALGNSYLTDASSAVIDVRALRAIRNNDLPKATTILEARLDAQLINLSFYHDALPPERRDFVVYRELAQVGKYRAEVPSSNPSPEVQAAITKALTLKPESGNRK